MRQKILTVESAVRAAESRGEWEGAALESRGFAARIGGSAAIASRWPRTRDNIPPATQAIATPQIISFHRTP